MITFKNYIELINENRAVVSNPRNIKAFIKQVEKKFPMYKGEIQQAEDDEIVFPNDPKLIKFFKGAREVKFVLKDSVELDEAMQFWTVTITKKAGKLFKGQTVDVKARNSAEAIKKGLKQMKANPNTVPSDSVDAVLGEELDERKDDYIVVIQGAGDNNQKIMQVFKGTQLNKAKKYRDDWNKKNSGKIKKNKKGKPMPAYMARLYNHPAGSTINGKPYIPKVGDDVSWSTFGNRIIKEEHLIEKPLTPQQRMQRSRIMKRLAPKMAMKRKMKAKKKADPNTLKARSEKKAREIIRAKIAKGDYDKMSYAQKIAIDKKVEAKRAVIKKLAKKLLPKVKKAEMDRIEKMRAATK